MGERAASPISKRNLARESEFLTHTLLASEGEFRILVRRSRGLHVEWMTAVLIAQVCAFSAQLERQSIARRTRAGLERARAEGRRLGRPPRIDDEQMTAIHQDLAEKMTLAAIGRKYGIPRTTLRDNLERANVQSQ